MRAAARDETIKEIQSSYEGLAAMEEIAEAKEVSVAFNSKYIAFGLSERKAFVYSNFTHRGIINDIIKNPRITKLISTPLCVLRQHAKSECKGCIHIINRLDRNQRKISEMNTEMMEQNSEPSLFFRAANVSLIIMKYKKSHQFASGNTRPHARKSCFNKKRDCYLLYLTAFNEIISLCGKIPFTELVAEVSKYPCLSRIKMHPMIALDGLVKIKALRSDGTFIYIPDVVNNIA